MQRQFNTVLLPVLSAIDAGKNKALALVVEIESIYLSSRFIYHTRLRTMQALKIAELTL